MHESTRRHRPECASRYSTQADRPEPSRARILEQLLSNLLPGTHSHWRLRRATGSRECGSPIEARRSRRSFRRTRGRDSVLSRSFRGHRSRGRPGSGWLRSGHPPEASTDVDGSVHRSNSARNRPRTRSSGRVRTGPDHRRCGAPDNHAARDQAPDGKLCCHYTRQCFHRGGDGLNSSGRGHRCEGRRYDKGCALHPMIGDGPASGCARHRSQCRICFCARIKDPFADCECGLKTKLDVRLGNEDRHREVFAEQVIPAQIDAVAHGVEFAVDEPGFGQDLLPHVSTPCRGLCIHP